MEIGDTVEATVIRIENYGIWLEAGGRTGLLMVPDISHRRLSHPSEVVKAGDLLTVKVLRFNSENGHFVASRKVLHPEEALDI